MSTAMVSLGIGTGFERQYGVLKRLGATPLGRPRWIVAKLTMVLVIEVGQVIILVPTALVLGWSPTAPSALVDPRLLLGTAAFAGIGLLMAGTLRGTVTLAAANGLYIVLLLLGGMIIPLSKLPAGIRFVAELLPAAALSQIMTAAFDSSAHVGRRQGVDRAGGLGRRRPAGRGPLLPLGVTQPSSARRRMSGMGVAVVPDVEDGQDGHVDHDGQGQSRVEDDRQDALVELQVHEDVGHGEELDRHQQQQHGGDAVGAAEYQPGTSATGRWTTSMAVSDGQEDGGEDVELLAGYSSTAPSRTLVGIGSAGRCGRWPWPRS